MQARRRLGHLVFGLFGTLFLLSAHSAQAEITFQSSFGAAGTGGGRFSTPAGVAINSSENNVYVVDRGQNRVEQFGAGGEFIRAWGYDVVLSGGDNKPLANELDEVRIRATSGSFVLTFQGQSTSSLPYDATSSQIETALNALTTINAGGGSVSVSGGPGDQAGEHPYLVTFNGGPLAGVNQELGIEPSGLGIPPGTQLICRGGSGGEGTASISYQWLANGVPVAGATSATFTPGATEEGKSVQCRVGATSGVAQTLATSRPYVLASPAPSTLPPLGPALIKAATGKAAVESAGGSELICEAGSWTRNPETFTFQWYRNGQPVGTPQTTTETTNGYVVTQADVATRAVFQCGVTGTNAGGSSTSFTAYLASEPMPSEPTAQQATATAVVASSGRSGVITRTNGGAVFEVCAPGPPANDVCKAGVAGNGLGQLNTPRSISVDNTASGEGDVYVMDDNNPRVQKFSAKGAPILMFGKEVDRTTDGNICTVASGDACEGGVTDVTGLPGGFAPIPGQSDNDYAELGNELAVDGAGNVYVADPRPNFDAVLPRIQKFTSSGAFLGQANISLSFLKPLSIAADSTERLFASQPGEFGGVERFSPGEFSPGGEGALRAGNVFDEEAPVQLTIDPRNDRLLVSDRNESKVRSTCGGAPAAGRAIVEFDTHQNNIDCSIPSGAGGLPQVTGMAVSSLGRLYVAVGPLNVIKVFKLPVSVAPSISTEAARDITTETAQIHAQINPGFEDTTYSVEYGTEDCGTGPCETSEGGVVHGLKFVDGATPISGLQPNTVYHYRVVAENGLGKVVGATRTFKTFPLVDLVNDHCPNALARKQTRTVGLLDCRAYELASASFTGGYDVESDLVAGQSPFDGYPDASGMLLYGVHNGGIPNTGEPTNRGLDPYIATRGQDGWSTKYVGIPSSNPFATAPFSSTVADAGDGLTTLAFSGPNICSPCFADGSSGIPVRLPDGQLAQGMAGSIAQPSATPAGFVGKAVSADGQHLVFGSASQFEPAGNNDGKVSIYERDLTAGTTAVVSTLPGGQTMDGATGEAGELDVSSDGSRVLVGEKVSTDSYGNSYWHPYLHLEGSTDSIDLAPGATSGVQFDGMTADGSQVYFTTTDKLLGQDTDESADIYDAEVDPEGALTLRLVSVRSDGSPSNSDACSPSNEPTSWNAASAKGKCGALAFAGGAGLASASGSLYFLSPEQLEGSNGELNQPNLYLAAPGANPRFVATIDTSIGKPGPQPPNRPLLDASFGGGTDEVTSGVAVDQSNGDVYALDPAVGKVFRFDSSGAPHKFTLGPNANTNTLTGLSFAEGVAVDNSASPLAGDVYVASETGVAVYARSGEKLGALNGSGTSKGSFEPCGVTVDAASGAVYVADFAGFVWRYAPTSGTTPVSDANYTVKGIGTPGLQPCGVAVDAAGHVYASKYFEGVVKRYESSSFATSPPSLSGTEVAPLGKAIAVDPTTNELYVDQGTQITVYNPSGGQIQTFGSGTLSCGEIGSRGVAVNSATHHVYASCFYPSAIREFGYEPIPFTPVDYPAILHATRQAAKHVYGDFQVTPDGRYAIFSTTRPLLAGYDDNGHYEVYRYDSAAGEPGGELTCVSCSPTESQAVSDSSLPPNGLGVLEDGRVFFNTGEQLTLRDTNEKLDAYEWEKGVQQLISTGNSAFPSGVLTASSDGKDLLFFTRDQLVGEDHNGQAMKIYDAREEGGSFAIPPPPPCAASDECHGPGTEAAAEPSLGTFKGTGGQFKEESAPPVTCRKGFIKRNGRCVKRHKPRHHGAKRHTRNRHRGGAR